MNLYNIEIEKNVLASLMSIDNLLATTGVNLQVHDFYSVRYQQIFEAILALHHDDKPYDIVMINDYLQSRGENLEDVLSEILQNGITAKFNFLAYVERLQDLSQRRKLKQVYQNALDDVINVETPITDLLNDTLAKLNNTDNVKTGYSLTAELCNGFLDDLHAKIKGDIEPYIDTGFLALNGKIMLSNGDLCVIAGRPSMGKSTLAQNILTYITHTTGDIGVFFSLEMSKKMVMDRLVSAMGGVSLATLKSGGKNRADGQPSEQEWVGITNAMQTLKNLPLVIDDTPQISLGYLRATLNKISHQHGKVGVVVVDYIGLMAEANGKDLVNGIGQITATLKTIAKEFNCPVIALAQLNRDLEKRPDQRPRMSDLRDSGKIEQDADQIIGMYRAEYYKPDDASLKGKAEAIVLKNRNGVIGGVELGFQGEFSRFVNLVDYE